MTMKFTKIFDTSKSRWFITGDLHLSHTNILKFCGRPFPNVTTMEDSIIGNINDVVRKNDHLIIAGDFCMGDPCSFFKRIECENIYFVLGSHDDNVKLSSSNKIKSIEYVMNLEWNGQMVVVSHCPFLCWEKSHYGSWNLFGHVHSGKLSKCENGEDPKGMSLFSQIFNHAKMLDIGVDGHDFMPWTFDQLKVFLDKKPGFLVDRKGDNG